MKQLRCVICGRFMSEEDDIVNVAYESVTDYDYAEPELAHRSCDS